MHQPQRVRRLTLSLLLPLALACDTAPDVDAYSFPDAPSAELVPSGAVEVITEDDLRYHVVTAFGFTMTIVENETGAVVIDVGPKADYLPTIGAELAAYADALDKPYSVIITHAHADHYGNVDQFSAVDVYADSAVVGELGKLDDFNAAFPGALKVVERSAEIYGLSYNFDRVSQAETGENAYIYLDSHKALFAEDLVYNRTHSYIREYTPLDDVDELDNWRTGLTELKSSFGDYQHVFVGHGGHRLDVATTIDENISYISDAQALILGSKTLSDGTSATTNHQVVDELARLYPDYESGALPLSLPDAFYEGDPGAIWFP